MNDASSEKEGKESSVQAFRCPECRGEIGFDPGAQKMVCQYCDHQLEIPDKEGMRSVVEHDLEAGLAQKMETGLGAKVRTSRCQECDATVNFPENMTAASCDFCGSSQVMEQEENRKLIRPESVLPFKVDRKAASARFTGWLKGLWFRPSDLKQRAKVTQISGVYVPYWTFDATVDSDWTADAGHYYYVTEEYTEEDDQGNEVTKTREVQKVRWESAWGARTDLFDDLLVPASKGLPENLARKLSSFDTGQLKPYDPAFLAGWKAEEYSLPLNEAWGKALQRMESTQESRCSGDVPGDTQRSLNVVNRFSKETFKHVLLPIWISAYRYQGKIYRFLVNGQTGEVAGKAPYSWLKISLFIGGIAGAIALGYWIYTMVAGG